MDPKLMTEIFLNSQKDIPKKKAPIIGAFFTRQIYLKIMLESNESRLNSFDLNWRRYVVILFQRTNQRRSHLRTGIGLAARRTNFQHLEC
jgi:hypothetical protein